MGGWGVDMISIIARMFFFYALDRVNTSKMIQTGKTEEKKCKY